MTEAIALGKRFQQPDHFRNFDKQASSYRLLPFNFEKLGHRYLVTNEVGEHYLVARDQLMALVDGDLDPRSDIYRNLRARHFLYDEESDSAIDLLALKVRTRYAPIRHFTALHIFVVTLRCDYSCPYCQVSRQTEDVARFDMDEETARRSLDLVFRSPSEAIKIEFQGGEPLLNFPMIRFVVDEAKKINEVEKRDLQFVIATNLTFVDDEVLSFCEANGIYISTSLDGPADLHNANRPRPKKDGHKRVREKIELIRSRLGPDRVAALMTTTDKSLDRPREIIDEYLDAGFQDIFLRPISPYGFAIKTHQAEKYDFERFFAFYCEALDYILELNRRGVPFVEHYSSLVLRKLLSPYPTGYVDLQSPAGAGITVLVYNYDGGVYASDEARMLAEMGDDTFKLGDVRTQSYEEIMLNPTLLSVLEDSLADSAPECYQCAYKPYCGSEPVYHHATQGDWVGHKAFSSFCAKTKRVTGHLIQKLADNDDDRRILEGWARR
jgi:uncharacterized protein